MTLGRGAWAPSRLTILFCVLALGWGALLAMLDRDRGAGILDIIEGASLDMRFTMRGPMPPPPEVVIVAIDDDTMAVIGYPPSRVALATLVERVGAAAPKAVAVDLLLLDAAGPAADDALARALSATPSILAAAAVFPAPGEGVATTPDGIPLAARLNWPEAPFTGASRVGVANIAVDASGAARHMPMLVAGGGSLAPAFSLVAAATYAGAAPRFGVESVDIGGVRQPLDLGSHLALDYYGPGGTIPTVSAASLLSDGAPPAGLAGRVVVIGFTALASGDVFQTPFDGNMTGAEVLATGIGNLLSGDGLVRDAAVRRISTCATVLLPVVVVLLMTIGRPLLGLALATGAVVAWLLICNLAFLYDYWLAAVLPIAAAAPMAIAFSTARHFAGELEASRISRSRDALARLQAPAVAERLSRDPDFLAAPVERQAAVLFLDLSGFTGLSERVGAYGTQAFLDAFHTATASATEEAGGLLVAFLGDGAMIFFGFDEGGPTEASRALAALPLLQRRICDLVAEHPAAAGMTVRFGVHFGPVVLSRLGSGAHQSITIAGDTVNVASRLLDLAKQRGAVAAVTDAVFDAARGVPPGFGPVEWTKVRGRVGDLAVRYAASIAEADDRRSRPVA